MTISSEVLMAPPSFLKILQAGFYIYTLIPFISVRFYIR
jgi:hypothetical protein